MTTTYDPRDPLYTDEAAVREEMARVFDICHECRRCVSLCTTFPTLFEMLAGIDGHDAGLMTPAQQDHVVDQCFQCKLCAVDCPFTPELHDLDVDFPRLALRARAMRFENDHGTARERSTARMLGSADRIGTLASILPDVANHVIAARPRSLARKLSAAISGISSSRLLAPYARQRFSAWFSARPRIKLRNRQAAVTVYPTCLVEYQEPNIGRDLVKVYERNGVECGRSEAACCGAALLHAGDLKRFRKVAKANVAVLAREVDQGTDVVVPQPTCGYILKHEYPRYVPGDEAELVASRTFDAAQYLMSLHGANDYVLDTEFDGDVPKTVTYQAPGHLRAQNIGYQGRDLMKLTGARVTLIQQSSGTESMWAYRASNDAVALEMAQRLGEKIDAAGGEVVAGGCHLSNVAITEQTGRQVSHPLQVIARAYGIHDEP
ncbi:heterodisulfide reductase-related iron-sulfur binding cluster [Ilumatobacter nonamiensis]|uniref:heterodisulfide reductase-related iron-sulfur binding cluster n=1 Tax=Ilumatobacter nonamiensis TaxID=467093 RepID=UPI000346533C|nr:heterodisulfide reductase-related iron-sulfur binding cluster [Ilumatobacter nonamiensis]